MMGLNKTLRTLRHVKGMTIEELAVKTGLSAVAIGKIERGINEPQVASLKKIAKLYDMEIGDILKIAEEKKGSKFILQAIKAQVRRKQQQDAS